MNDEKLIEMVRDYPVLYDLSHAKYNDINYKNGIWKEIAKQLKEDWPSCKTRWNNIRDNYRKSLKKTVQQSGASAKKLNLINMRRKWDS
nr:transcription factor Adf-1-like [Onthophagus taurus]